MPEQASPEHPDIKPGPDTDHSSALDAERPRESIWFLVFALAGLAAFGLAYIRYGFDPWDEGCHLSAALRYCLGDLPFRDEWNHSLSMFDVVLSVFFRVFPDAGLYAARALKVVLELCWIGSLALLLRRYAPTSVLALACLAVTFMGHRVKTPSYNELARAGLYLSIVLWLTAVCTQHSRRIAPLLAICGGIGFTISALCYLPLFALFVVPVGVLILHRLGRIRMDSARGSTWLFLLAAGVMLGACIAAMAIKGVLGDYSTNLRWHLTIAFSSNAPHAASAEKRGTYLLTSWYPLIPYILGGLGATWFVFGFLPRRIQVRRWIAVSSLIVVAVFTAWLAYRKIFSVPAPLEPWAFFAEDFRLNFWLLIFAFVLNLFAFTLRWWLPADGVNPTGRNEWAFIRGVLLVIAILHMFTKTLFSTNGILNTTFAVPPLLLLGVADVCWSLRAATRSVPAVAVRVQWATGALALALVVLGAGHLTWVYINADRYGAQLADLTARFSEPVLRGIRSTTTAVRDVEGLVGYLRPRLRPGDFLYQQDDFPMIYFLLRSRPALPRVWSPLRVGLPVADRQRMLDYMLVRNRIPRYFVREDESRPGAPATSSSSGLPHVMVDSDVTAKDDPIRKYFAEHYHPTTSFGRFEVWERNLPQCVPTSLSAP